MGQPMSILEIVMATAPVQVGSVAPKVPFPRSLCGSLELFAQILQAGGNLKNYCPITVAQGRTDVCAKNTPLGT